MSFMDFTLVPHTGTMVFCESISEFDENHPVPMEREIGSKVDSEKLQSDMAKLLDDDVSLYRIKESLRVLWDQYINVMIRLPLYTDPKSLMELSGRVQELTSAYYHKVTTLLRKVTTTEKLFNTEMGGKTIYAPIVSCMKYIVGHMDSLKRDGRNKVEYTSTVHPMFVSYEVTRTVNYMMKLIKSANERGDLITLQDLSFVDSASSIEKYFANVDDMVDTMTKEFERCGRQEEHALYRIDLESVLKYELPEEECCRPVCRENPSGMYERIFKMLAKCNGKAQVALHNIQIETTDPELEDQYDARKALESIKTVMAAAYNSYLICFFILISIGYQIEECSSRKRAIESTVEMLHKVYKI